MFAACKVCDIRFKIGIWFRLNDVHRRPAGLQIELILEILRFHRKRSVRFMHLVEICIGHAISEVISS
jgi:hypothetical protein